MEQGDDRQAGQVEPDPRSAGRLHHVGAPDPNLWFAIFSSKKFAFLMREEEDKVQSTSAKQISQTISTYSMQLCQLSCHTMETNSIEIAMSVLSVVA